MFENFLTRCKGMVYTEVQKRYMNSLEGKMINILSFIMAIVSICLGIYAIVQSYRYNKQSEQIFSDINYLIMRQVAILDHIKYDTERYKRKFSNVIDMSKDQIHFHKLSGFNKKDIKNIMNEIKKLPIKRKFLDDIENYLYSDKQHYLTSFYNNACEINNERIDFWSFYMIFLQYNIAIDIMP